MESKRRTKSPISYRAKSFLPKQSETERLLSQPQPEPANKKAREVRGTFSARASKQESEEGPGDLFSPSQQTRKRGRSGGPFQPEPANRKAREVRRTFSLLGSAG
ncbi:hypothetical protein DHL47_04055 [Streptococcus panodentis]|uniref:Uncharacterized protein n=1 Tax=Streptococcus panodentis TaxID=1581472 RepID=A0ABS5AWA6_9STRE|nr:hypothetical protein [Streptococcus panodentis]